MQLSMVTDSLGHLPLEEVLETAAEAGLDAVEIATGNWSEPPNARCCTPRTQHRRSGGHG